MTLSMIERLSNAVNNCDADKEQVAFIEMLFNGAGLNVQDADTAEQEADVRQYRKAEKRRALARINRAK